MNVGTLAPLRSDAPTESVRSGVPAPRTECGDRCLDLSTDVHNCGACDSPCKSPEICRAGRCELATCPPGYALVWPQPFTMGSPVDEPGHRDDEAQQSISFSHALCMGAMEVTHRDYVARMGAHEPCSQPLGDLSPVGSVTWFQAVAYLDRLSSEAGLEPCYRCTDANCKPAIDPATCRGYRLPLETEWEHGARAGSTTAFPTGPVTYPSPPLVNGVYQVDYPTDPNLDRMGWFNYNSAVVYDPAFPAAVVPHPVGAEGTECLGGSTIWRATRESGPTAPQPNGTGQERVVRGGRRRRLGRGLSKCCSPDAGSCSLVLRAGLPRLPDPLLKLSGGVTWKPR